LSRLEEVGKQAVIIVDEGTDGYLYNHVVTLLAGTVVARTVPATFGLYEVAMSVWFEGLEVFGGSKDNGSPVTATATVRSAARLVLLAVKRHRPVAAASRADDEPGFIDELQRG
jgi:hypothetical protein